MGNQRETYGRILVELGKNNRDIVALDADLSKSTMSCLFQTSFPRRYFEMGIAESNMASFAAGLSLTGKIPFIHSFAMFTTGRCYEQIRQSICIGNFNVKIIGSSYGLSDFGDGATHQVVEDLSLTRGLPNMTVLAPVDAAETEKAVHLAVRTMGPVYIRLNRNDMPELSDPDGPFEIGHIGLIRDGKDAIVFAHGIMVSKALDAAECLKTEGIKVKVVNVAGLKPADETKLRTLAKGCRCIVAAEEHSIYGGLSDVILKTFKGTGIPTEIIGIQDQFGQSAHSYQELLEHYGLTSKAIVKAVTKGLKGDR